MFSDAMNTSIACPSFHSSPSGLSRCQSSTGTRTGINIKQARLRYFVAGQPRPAKPRSSAAPKQLDQAVEPIAHSAPTPFARRSGRRAGGIRRGCGRAMRGMGVYCLAPASPRKFRARYDVSGRCGDLAHFFDNSMGVPSIERSNIDNCSVCSHALYSPERGIFLRSTRRHAVQGAISRQLGQYA